MTPKNESTVTEFIILGLTNDPDSQLLIFLLLLPVYIFTLLGNISIVVIVWLSTSLHTPMYFFLTQLALLDITYSSVVSPKMLADLLIEKKTISFSGCLAQIFFFGACGSTEFFLLAAMAYDRYVAICNPLLYTLAMTENLCACLVSWSYVAGFLHSLIHAVCLLRLHFCGSNVINHFACDYPVLLKLSCTDVAINDMLRFVLAPFVVVSSLVVIAVSYSFIVKTIAKIPTAAGKSRASSTCVSHFTCVFLFFGSAFLMEMRPYSSSSAEQNKVVAVIPTLFIPSLNPLIYSLRNKEVKEALRRILSKADCLGKDITAAFRKT